MSKTLLWRELPRLLTSELRWLDDEPELACNTMKLEARRLAEFGLLRYSGSVQAGLGLGLAAG